MPRRPPRIVEPALLAELRRAMQLGAMSIGDISRVMRAEKGLPQSEFAHSLGVGLNVIKGIESGRGNPSLRSIEKLAAAAGLRVALISTDSPSVTLVSSRALARDEDRRRRHGLREVKRGRKSLRRYSLENALTLEGARFGPIDIPE